MTQPVQNDETTTAETNGPGRLPESFPEARDQLAIEGDITNSSEWRRAAIVYALTEPKQGQRTDLTSSNVGRSFSVVGKISFQALADWKVIGLRKRQHVSAYWHFWQAAIDAELAEPIELGDPYVEPDMEWPGFRHYKGDPDAEPKKGPEPFTQVCNLLAAAVDKIWGAIDLILDELDDDDREDLRGPTQDGVRAAMGDLWDVLYCGPEQLDSVRRVWREEADLREQHPGSHKLPVEMYARDLKRNLQDMKELAGHLDAKHHHHLRETMRGLQSEADNIIDMCDAPKPDQRKERQRLGIAVGGDGRVPL